MTFQKKIEDIKFTKRKFDGEEMEVSDEIVMASAAGWYVGAICRDLESGLVEPFDRFTGYYATPEEAEGIYNMFFKEDWRKLYE